MKFILILLLAINAFLFSFWNGWISPWDSREPERLKRQVDAERITVLTGPAAGKPGSEPAAKPAGDAAGTERAAATITPPGQVCLEFPPLEPDKAQALASSMKQAGLQVDAQSLEANISYIVFLAPSESMREAQRKLAELKRLGVDEAYLFMDGPMRLGISLGLFRVEEGAKTRVQELASKGIRAARIAQSPGSRGPRTLLRVTGSETQMTRVRQAATEVSLALKNCER